MENELPGKWVSHLPQSFWHLVSLQLLLFSVQIFSNLDLKNNILLFWHFNLDNLGSFGVKPTFIFTMDICAFPVHVVSRIKVIAPSYFRVLLWLLKINFLCPEVMNELIVSFYGKYNRFNNFKQYKARRFSSSIVNCNMKLDWLHDSAWKRVKSIPSLRIKPKSIQTRTRRSKMARKEPRRNWFIAHDLFSENRK